MSLNVFLIVRVVISKYRCGSISVFATLVNRFVPVALGEWFLNFFVRYGLFDFVACYGLTLSLSGSKYSGFIVLFI